MEIVETERTYMQREIDAFDRFKEQTGSDWQLVLAGSDWHGADVIHARIQHSPHAGDIRTPGFVPDRDLPMLNRAAEVFVFPSLYEGFGLPPVEAMACGCPVISSTRGSLGEVVGNAAVTVDPEDIDALKTQMARLATDADLRDRLRNAGLDHAKQFDWNRTAAATMEVYRRVVDKAAPQPG
jgi:glycosyltransferase involved in cell wall biosynthesis